MARVIQFLPQPLKGLEFGNAALETIYLRSRLNMSQYAPRAPPEIASAIRVF